MLLLQGPNPSVQPWHMTLSASDLISVGGTCVTAISIAVAVFQWLQAKSARKQVQQARQKLVQQQIAQRFSEMATKATDLLRQIRSGSWDDCVETALVLNAGLANAHGIPLKLMGQEKKAQIATAVNVMSDLMRALPRNGANTEAELSLRLMEGCQLVVLSVLAVSEELRLTTALEEGSYE